MVQHKPEPERRLSGVLPSEPLEPVSVLLQLRGARLKEGDHLELIIPDGTALYQGSIDAGREELTTAFGTNPAIKLLCKGNGSIRTAARRDASCALQRCGCQTTRAGCPFWSWHRPIWAAGSSS